MSTLKPIKSAYPTGSQFLPFFFLNPKGVKSRSILEIAKLLLITSVLLLGYNLTFAQHGSLDNSFDSGTGPNDWIYSTSIQSDGRIIIGGLFRSYNGIEINRIARLHPDGSLDTSFETGTGVDGEGITTIIQKDGKILIGGFFSSYNGIERNGVARLNADGSLDTTFDPGSGVDAWITSISVQNDGKILIAGNFSIFNGTERNGLARLHPDGSLDTSFDLGLGPDRNFYTTTIQSDGKILVGGWFSSFNGIERSGILRLNADGSLDPSFESGTGVYGEVNYIIIQSDGKILIGGLFSLYNGIRRKGLARLHTDGSLDTSFDPEPGGTAWITSITVQSDRKILIGGNFSSLNGTERKDLARLHPDGSLDTSFDPGMGPDKRVITTALQGDGKIIIAGNFNSYNGTEIRKIARLFSTTSTSVSPPLEEESKIVKIFPNPFSTNTTTLHSDIQLKNAALTIFNSIGQTVKQITPIHIEAGNNFTLSRDQLPTGLYFIQLSQDNQVIMNDKLVITD